jgi:SAM-dependent methyltransferase
MTTTTQASADYVMDRSDAETERLRTQSQFYEEPTHALLDRVGLAPGMSCLEPGCGGGDVMRLLAERVGREGRVTGLDVDGALGRSVAADLREEVETGIEFIEGDVLEVALWPSAFDLDDPAAALRRMWEWTAPGGHVAVLDYDFRSVERQDSVALQALYDLLAAVFEGAGRDTRFGGTLPAQFERAGIGDPDGTAISGPLRPLDEIAPWLAATFHSLVPAAERLGIETEERRERFSAALEDELRGPRRYFVGPLMVSAWKRKEDAR